MTLTLTLIRRPSYTKLTRIPLRHTLCAKMNFVRQGFRKLSYYSPRMRALTLSYSWSLPVTWQRWRSRSCSCHTRKPRATRKPHGPMFYRTGVWPLEVLHCGNRDFRSFLLLWPWPWHNDFHLWTWPVFSRDMLDMQIWTSYFKAFKSYHLTNRQTDIQTDTAEIIYSKEAKVIKTETK